MNKNVDSHAKIKSKIVIGLFISSKKLENYRNLYSYEPMGYLFAMLQHRLGGPIKSPLDLVQK